MKNISVFCGAHEGNNPRYAEDARKIGEILAAKGINVVFGGGNVGQHYRHQRQHLFLSLIHI